MKTSILRVSAVIFIAAAAGCSESNVASTPRESGVTQGYISPHGTLVAGDYAPDVTFTMPDGKQSTLHTSRQAISIVAFTAAQEPCNRLDPRLVDKASTLWHLPVSLVQISEPSPACPQGPGCHLVTGPGRHDVMALCDQSRMAWTAYGRPATNTVFLVDEDRKILEVGTLDNMNSLIDRAGRHGQRIADMHKGDGGGQY